MLKERLLPLLAILSLGLPFVAEGSGIAAGVQPSTIFLTPFQQQQFTLAGYGTNINWSVQPSNMGTITQTGLYTAPAVNGVAFIYAQPEGSANSFIGVVYLSQSVGITASSGTMPTPSPVGTSGPTVPTGTSPAPVTVGSSPSGPTPASPVVSVGIAPTSPTQPAPSQSTQSTITSVSISINPASIYVQAGQSVFFTASVQGTSNQQVQWSLSPNLGTIVNGYYTAPASFGSEAQVTVSATSLADPSKTATATVLLAQPLTAAPTVGISIQEGLTTLTAGQSAQFKVLVTGTTNTGVTWSLSPNVGTISNGYYTAPAGVTSQETVTLTATSQAQPTKTATVVLVLKPVANPVAPTPTISISLSPGSKSLEGGQTATFTPTLSGTSNTAVTWSISPQVGTISNGVYQAPATIASQQNITVTATSGANSAKTATATVTLIPEGLTVAPASASLNGGKTATFTATVSGAANTAVTWSISPQVGTISNGVYQAPATIASQQTIKVTATSVANSAKTAVATVTLIPVAVTVGPTSASLAAGKSATFSATVSGSSNTAVTWSLTPAVGTLVSGVYTAPATISTAQTVTLKATSAADSTKTATATVSLQPLAVVVGVTVAPASASLSAGTSATFTASVTGSSNTGVTWSMSPSVGTLVNGVYTAPATISLAQTVTVKATSAADGTKTASASVSLAPTSSAVVTLPVEVMGADGTTVTVPFGIVSGANLTAPLTLWMQVHGVKYDSEASVQVNSSAWMPLSTGRVTLLGNANAFGGIGGGFHTLEMTLNLPAGTVLSGANTITFRFNGTDGIVSGYRVLAFNIQSGGSNLIPASQFVNDDPNAWQPPSSASSDIAAGLSLYQTAALTIPVSGGRQSIQAHCSDCHTVDGRDLKYFNYSNHAIEVRSEFHGLTAQQGSQIASYIRSLNLPNPGTPWNPPYQPGPGSDSQPVSTWAAGAGLTAVLDNDSDMQQYLAPGGSTAGWAANAYLNPRETPIDFQLPDWNSWLPTIHPTDAFGATFTNSSINTLFQTLRSTLQPNSAAAYHNAVLYDVFTKWFEAAESFLVPIETTNGNAGWTATSRQQVYSVALWQMVKLWEVNQEFGLEAMPQVPFGAKANVRGWLGMQAFNTSPNILHITAGPGIGNGSQTAMDYITLAWYQTQLVQNDGQGLQTGHNPLDYAYVYGHIVDLFWNSAHLPAIGLQLEWNIKALQEFTLSGIGPQAGNGSESAGWDVLVTGPTYLVAQNWAPLWSATSPATQTALLQAFTQSWFNQASRYTPQQYYLGGYASATQNPATISYSETFGGQVWFSLPRLRYLGVDASLTDQISDWAAKIWPQGNWSFNNSATCSSLLNCTSGY